MANPDPQSPILNSQFAIHNSQSEISLIVTAAHALHLDAPIIAYRIHGSRIELYTCHGGPFIYDPSKKRAWRARASKKGK